MTAIQTGHTPMLDITARAPSGRIGGDAPGTNISALIRDRLVSLTVTDEAGVSADRLELELDDRDGRLEMPARGLVLTVQLGMSTESLMPVGRFAVDHVRLSGPVRRMIVEAHAADLGASIRAPRTRALQGVTLGALVATIAGEHGLTPACSPDLAGHSWPQVVQNGESDINLLTRLARGLDATAKATDGVLVVAKRGAGTNAAGQALPVTALAAQDLTEWEWRRTERDSYGAVTARWRDVRGGRTESLTLGSGKPERTLRRIHGTEAEARRAAQAALDEARRGESLELTLAGFGAGCFAGARIRVTGLRGEADGTWHLKRVEHRLDRALTTRLSAERETP
jgi:uncharacterized protein